MCVDAKDFYLNTPIPQYEYARIQFSMIPEEFMIKYNLHSSLHSGYIYIDIRTVMYRLPQSVCIAPDYLKKLTK